jgi:PAS domain S-box-containing protein
MPQSFDLDRSLNPLIAKGNLTLPSMKERQLQAIFETALDAIAIADDRGHYLDVNPAACELFGLTKDELLGRCIWEFAAEGFNFPAAEEFPQQKKLRGEFQLVRPDGGLRTVEYAVTANFLPHRHLSVMRDITRCKLAETRVEELTRQLAVAQLQLQESGIAPASSSIPTEYDRLEQIATRIPGIIYQFQMFADGSFHFPYINGSVREIYGVTREAAQQDIACFFQNVHREDIDRVYRSILDSAAHLTPWYCEYRLCFPDGQLVWLRGDSIPQREPDGSTVWHGCVMDITESKSAEIALRNSEEKFRSIIENLNDLVYIIEPEGRFNYLSAQFKNVTGHEVADWLNSSFAKWVYPEDLPICIDAMHRCLQGEKLRGIEYRVLHQDGNYYWHSSNLSALENESGQVVACLGIARYIHDRKQTEIELANSQAELMALFNAIQDVIILLNSEGHLLKIAPTSAPLLYRPPAEVLGKTVREIFTQDTADIFLNTIRETLDTRSRMRLEYSLPIGDRLVCFDASVSPLSEDRVVWVARDITDSKRQEQSLRLIVEGTAAKTGQDYFKSCVQYLAQVLEVRYALIAEVIDSENSIAKTLAFWAGDDFADNFTYSLKGAPCRYSQTEFCFYRDSVQSLFPEDGDLVTLQVESYSGLPILDAAGNRLGFMAVMDTKPMEKALETQSAILRIFATRTGAEIERMQAEATVRRSSLQLQQQTEELETTLNKLQNTQTQLIQAEKMSSLGQLVAGIAHEINNPVSFIYGNIQPAADYASDLIELLRLYQEHYPNPPQAISDFRESIDFEYLVSDFTRLLISMKTGATRISDIVKSLRTFSRLDEADLKEIDIHQNIDCTLVILQNRLNGRAGQSEIKVRKNYAKLPLVECYGSLLSQVFMNLLVNAIDAIEQRQDNLEPGERSNYAGEIAIATSIASENRVLISIQDNGCGMSPQVQEKIFNPFFTTKPVGKGTGMGLATTYQIVTENHRGSLDCLSASGEGTEFAILLPLSTK